MYTDAYLHNVVIAWVEEVLDRYEAFTGAKVIRAGEDAPRPMESFKDGTCSKGSSLFVTVDLTQDGDVTPSGQPITHQAVIDGGLKMLITRSYTREASFSISCYRDTGFDAARELVRSCQGEQAAATFFNPHGLTMTRVESVARLRDIVHDQWEHRAQFGISFRYVDCDTDEIGTIGYGCINDEIVNCEPCEVLEIVEPECIGLVS